MEIPKGSVLTVEEDASLTIPPNVKLNNNGNIVNKGKITNNGTLQNKGKINSTGKITSFTEIENVEGNNVEIIYYDITIKTSDGGVSDSDKNLKSKHGENKTISIIPDVGYKIKSVLVNGKDKTNAIINGKLTLSNIDDDIVVIIKFEKIDCNVTINVGNGGTISPHKDFKVKYGENTLFNILPDDGYELKSVFVNSKNKTNDVINGKLILSNITKNININVEFEKIDYDVTTNVGNGGTISPHKDFKVKYGENTIFNILPDDGYKLKSVVVNGKNKTNDVINGKLILSNITKNININIEFTKIDYDVTINVGNGGTISPYKDFKVKYAENIIFNIFTHDGYELKSVVVNGKEMSNDVINGKLILSNITENININVEFKKKIYNISIDNPETYDNIALYFLLDLVAIVGLILSIYFNKYNHNKIR